MPTTLPAFKDFSLLDMYVWQNARLAYVKSQTQFSLLQKRLSLLCSPFWVKYL